MLRYTGRVIFSVAPAQAYCRPPELRAGSEPVFYGDAMPQIFNWPGRLRELADFVGFDQADLDLVQSTAAVVMENADWLTATVYDNFLENPETRKFFVNQQGEVDETRLDRRKHTLARWLRGSIGFQLDQDYPIRALATGIVHSNPPSHRAHLGSIPARFMIGTMSFIQTAMSNLFKDEMDDPAEALRAAIAWNKLLMLQLDIMLAGYMVETPTEPTEVPEHLKHLMAD